MKEFICYSSIIIAMVGFGYGVIGLVASYIKASLKK